MIFIGLNTYISYTFEGYISETTAKMHKCRIMNEEQYLDMNGENVWIRSCGGCKFINEKMDSILYNRSARYTIDCGGDYSVYPYMSKTSEKCHINDYDKMLTVAMDMMCKWPYAKKLENFTNSEGAMNCLTNIHNFTTVSTFISKKSDLKRKLDFYHKS